MPINRRDIEWIARLARLRLGEDEMVSLAEECDRVLRHFESLPRVDEGTPEGAGEEGNGAPLREDRVDPDRLHLPLAEMAPAWLEGFFVLPRLPALSSEGGETEPAAPEEGP